MATCRASRTTLIALDVSNSLQTRARCWHLTFGRKRQESTTLCLGRSSDLIRRNWRYSRRRPCHLSCTYWTVTMAHTSSMVRRALEKRTRWASSVRSMKRVKELYLRASSLSSVVLKSFSLKTWSRIGKFTFRSFRSTWSKCLTCWTLRLRKWVSEKSKVKSLSVTLSKCPWKPSSRQWI